MTAYLTFDPVAQYNAITKVPGGYSAILDKPFSVRRLARRLAREKRTAGHLGVGAQVRLASTPNQLILNERAYVANKLRPYFTPQRLAIESLEIITVAAQLSDGSRMVMRWAVFMVT